MATVTNKILLKDKSGNILLPITRSTLIEMSSANQKNFTYKDLEGQHVLKDVDEALAYLHAWQGRQDGRLSHLIDAINEELPHAFTAGSITFNNSQYTNPASPLYKGTEENPSKTGYVQGAIEALEQKLSTTVDEVSQLVTTAGVSGAIGEGVITVTGTETGENNIQKGNLTIGLNIDNSTLVVDQQTSHLQVGNVDASKIQYSKGEGDNLVQTTVRSELDSILTRLEGVATDGNLAELRGRVTTVEGVAATAKTQSENILLTKDANSGDYAAVYTFTSYNGTQTKINIPKDQFLQDVEYVATAPAGSTEQEAAQYPAMVFTWIVDNDNDSTSPTPKSGNKTIIPVADLVAGAETKADQALTVLGVERTNIGTEQNPQYVITVPQDASDAITNKSTVEQQIVGLDSALQDVVATASTALQDVYFNDNKATVVNNVAHIEAYSYNITVGELTNYQTPPSALATTDSIATAISKLQYNSERIENLIELSYLEGGSVDPISNGFAGFTFPQS